MTVAELRKVIVELEKEISKGEWVETNKELIILYKNKIKEVEKNTINNFLKNSYENNRNSKRSK